MLLVAVSGMLVNMATAVVLGLANMALIAGLELATEQVDSITWDDKYAGSGSGAGSREIDFDLAGQYGVYSRAPDGGDGVVVKLGGKGDSAICIGVGCYLIGSWLSEHAAKTKPVTS